MPHDRWCYNSIPLASKTIVTKPPIKNFACTTLGVSAHLLNDLDRACTNCGRFRHSPAMAMRKRTKARMLPMDIQSTLHVGTDPCKDFHNRRSVCAKQIQSSYNCLCKPSHKQHQHALFHRYKNYIALLDHDGSKWFGEGSAKLINLLFTLAKFVFHKNSGKFSVMLYHRAACCMLVI
jgi:hypothetical protein